MLPHRLRRSPRYKAEGSLDLIRDVGRDTPGGELGQHVLIDEEMGPGLGLVEGFEEGGLGRWLERSLRHPGLTVPR